MEDFNFNKEAVEALAIANANFGNLLLKVIYSGPGTYLLTAK